MGDANMDSSAAMADGQDVRLIHVRDEHCADSRLTGDAPLGASWYA
jgi:hypothetical protein